MAEGYDNGPAQEEGPSKSELKRQMHARQALGEALVALSERELAGIPIDSEPLLEAIAQARRIRSNSARRRQLQYIGKLMRSIDPGPIQSALDALHQPRREATDAFHELERLRDELLAGGTPAIEQVVARWPGADRQQLRQLVLQHQREQARGKPPAASRKLFRYLRELAQG